jgi:hypothetical protein
VPRLAALAACALALLVTVSAAEATPGKLGIFIH